MEKGIGIFYPIERPIKRKGGHADGERIPQGTGIDHVRAGIIAGRACRPTAGVIRPGVKLLLTVALEEEVTDVLRRRPYERSQGNIRGYRNGHRERQVSCGAAEIEIAMPPGFRYRRNLSFSIARSLAAS